MKKSMQVLNPFPKPFPKSTVQTTAAALYRDIDNLELYVSELGFSLILNNFLRKVGLQAEEAKHPTYGAGLCPGYTISRAILADAVALSRGDRYMTTEFTRMPISSVILARMRNNLCSIQLHRMGLPRLPIRYRGRLLRRNAIETPLQDSSPVFSERFGLFSFSLP
jgi:hypothetical protein